ncbi:D-glycero-beta-D-manno-heptose 1-phosphate adenylyltransferase [Nocardia bhagyanarayanae]|uniref:D-glycero-beta-D-manno-heptose 1-phosphate adenylyltransferase n=1 Tax=Nocardia bhagyanarayanae TaxID=1215925 RepID=A0A543EY30_9NOCA|nr:D-glycero-beta-D-manno-heptose 1-phosphate adenylyltransferase [Nocardia bhagyanarayanae]TQM26503.1 rfaE bifunctional protein nucleotidyltransferase chain/domain [Nocardia bhagyanarayanae]
MSQDDGLGPAAANRVDATIVDSGGAILPRDRLIEALRRHRAAGARIVFTNGCFDVLHAGHIAYLDEAKRLGDVLVVAVNSDRTVRKLKGPDRPVNPQGDRCAVLAALGCVDHVTVFDEDTPIELLRATEPDVYVKGGDYRPEALPESPIVRAYGGEVRVLGYLADRSTSAMIERIRTSASSDGLSSHG